MMELSEALNGARTNAESLVRPLLAEADRDQPVGSGNGSATLSRWLQFSVLRASKRVHRRCGAEQRAPRDWDRISGDDDGARRSHGALPSNHLASSHASRGRPLWINIDARNRSTGHPPAQSPRSPLASSTAEQQTEKNGTAADFSFPRYTTACRDRGVLALQAVPHTLGTC